MPNIIQIPLNQLKYFKPLGPQFKPNEQVEAMAADIRKSGIRTPLIVRPVGDLFEVVCGLVRWKGAIVAGLATAPAEVRNLTDDEALELSMSDNIRELDDIDFHFDSDDSFTDMTLSSGTARVVGPYKIDEPLGRGFCKLFSNDFSIEEVKKILQTSDVDYRNLENDLSMFWAGLKNGRLHLEGSGYDCGQVLLCYIEAYLDPEKPDVAFRGPNQELWGQLTESERAEVAADAERLSPIVNGAMPIPSA